MCYCRFISVLFQLCEQLNKDDRPVVRHPADDYDLHAG